MAKFTFDEAGHLLLSADDAAREFGIPRSTMYRKLKAVGIDTKNGVTIQDCVRAAYGDLYEQRVGLVTAQRRMAEMREAEMRGRLIDMEELGKALIPTLAEVRNAVEDSRATDDEVAAILRACNGIVTALADTLKAGSAKPDAEPTDKEAIIQGVIDELSTD
jgi:hypothetical protein